MSDELMQQIKQAVDAEYRRGFDVGWSNGNVAAWRLIAEFAAKKADAAEAFLDPSRQSGVKEAPDEVAVETSVAENVQDIDSEPRLTPGKRRALAFITENPGLKAHEIRGIGQGTLSGLVKAGIVTRIDGRLYRAPEQGSF